MVMVSFMKILNASFLYSVPAWDLLKPHDPAIVFLGRSNVGKSSFINALCHRKDLARVDKKTDQNRHAVLYELFYEKSQSERKLYLIDLPGYGYANMPQKEALACEDLIKSIIANYNHISLVCLLLDSRRDLDEREKTLIKIINQRNIPYIIILTKADKLSQSQRQPIAKKIIK